MSSPQVISAVVVLSEWISIKPESCSQQLSAVCSVKMFRSSLQREEVKAKRVGLPEDGEGGENILWVFVIGEVKHELNNLGYKKLLIYLLHTVNIWSKVKSPLLFTFLQLQPPLFVSPLALSADPCPSLSFASTPPLCLLRVVLCRDIQGSVCSDRARAKIKRLSSNLIS